ncbi:nitrous oxidase accessory protein [Aneurinibacillus soli]|uniref:Periplasmic copper-binding protein NosD n=2 Tax=Aneurinibacillus soli TaxID=1500254 RepID=A0A0U5B7R0_9BACL|nr:nitrous oxidase accessory protein [Aneurinibacillus soli]BAU26813.1 periplasmic copper-binding protein NosD [Aneurinibacillus soli]
MNGGGCRIRTYWLAILMMCALLAGTPVHVQAAPSLSSMLASAKPGDTLTLPAGTYEGPVRITKSITLLAEPGAVLEGNHEGSVLLIEADNVTVQGLTIRGTGESVADFDAAIKVSGNHAILRNNTIQTDAFGIHFDRSTGSKAESNIIKGRNDIPLPQRGNGIQLTGKGKHVLENNHLYDMQDGVYFDGTYDNIVRNNSVTNSRYGYHVMFSDRNTLEHNQATNSTIGAMVMDGENTRITGNIFSGQRNSEGYALFLYDARGATVTNNQLTRNSIGLALDMTDGVTISNNRIAENAIGVKRVGNVLDTHLTRNIFTGNVRPIGGKANWNADVWSLNKIGNYWDDYSGFDLNGDNIGDSPYRMADGMLKTMDQNPLLAIFYASPLQQLLEQLTGSDGTFDRYPLLLPPATS